MDTDAGPDYGNALVRVRLHAPDLLLGRDGGVEWLYVITSATLLAGYWLRTRRRLDG
ncbi:MAG: hypothetical protein JWP76_4227 [Dactylosporangium sp.]|jgi:hypothetical protein|nr:hypothetical protein [Dactylosporangium sp.]